MKLEVKDLLDLDRTIAAKLFDGAGYPWQVLDKLGDFILELGPMLPEDEYEHFPGDVWIARDARVLHFVTVNGPCIIDRGAEVRQCAFLRGNVIVGKNAVVGNSTELKNALLFDGVQVPHYNYVGDSVLGYKAHMGAGAVTSNVKNDKTPVVVKNGDECIETGRKKFGAILGDFAEVGCNSVLNPGTVIGRSTSVYPLSSVRGCVPGGSIYKSAADIAPKK